jgi:hypothetical protein
MLQHGTVHASLYNAFSFGLFAAYELESEDRELVQKLISEWRSQHRRPNDDRLRSCPALVWKIARRSSGVVAGWGTVSGDPEVMPRPRAMARGRPITSVRTDEEYHGEPQSNP